MWSESFFCHSSFSIPLKWGDFCHHRSTMMISFDDGNAKLNSQHAHNFNQMLQTNTSTLLFELDRKRDIYNNSGNP